VACVFEVTDLTAGRGEHGGRSQHADPGNREQPRTGRRLTGELAELFLEIPDAHFQQADLIEH
jgi:hypothetical protein